MDYYKKALELHEKYKGKIDIKCDMPLNNREDLAVAYTPGVAQPCLEIAEDPENAYKYTSKGHLVAIVTDGSAVLGLGNIGGMAGMPVMEGKAALFKRFGGVDGFPICLSTQNTEEIIAAVRAIAPTFGGINLEDIKAPQCFYIEERLKRTLDIPVMHDDQHGTAIISAAGLKNALEVNGKDIAKVKIVVNGAGAAAISCTKMYVALGAKTENILMLDSKGVITSDRENLTEQKKLFATDRRDVHTLEEAIKGADVFVGLSKGNVLTQDMIRSMAEQPIVFALANPVPEISYEDAMASRPDVLMSTGRSDYPNQINNILGFPFIFRGALDVRATEITENMKKAAALALAKLTKEKVPEEVKKAYGGKDFSFGRDYIVPKPFDPRVIEWEAVAVAKAAVEDGVALSPITDWEGYRERLRNRMKSYWK